MRAISPNVSLRILLFIAVFTGLPACAQSLDQDAIAPERAKLTDFISNMQGQYTVHYSDYDSTGALLGTNIATTKYYYNSAVGGSRLDSLIIHTDRPAAGETIAANPSYYFCLEKKTENGNPVISQFRREEKYSASDNGFLMAAYDYIGTSFAEFASGKSGKVLSSSQVLVDGHQCIKVETSRKFPRSTEVLPGSVTLDPEEHYAIVAYEQIYEWGSIKGTVKYQKVEKNVAFPGDLIERDIYDPEIVKNRGLALQETRVHFDIPTPCQMPAEKFRLEDFGLKEPADKPDVPLGNQNVAP